MLFSVRLRSGGGDHRATGLTATSATRACASSRGCVTINALLPPGDISSFTGAIGKFFSSLGDVGLGSLLLGMASFAVYITLRTRAWFHAVRAAYPTGRIRWRRLWGAYWATFAVNNVVPFRGGEVIRLVLGRASVPGSTYAAVGASFLVEHVFDASLAVLTLGFAFTQGVFPKPPDFAKLHAFDLSFLAVHFRFTLFLLTAVAVGGLAAFAILSRRVQEFWVRVRQGWTILFDRRRYFREVWLVQLLATAFRFAAYWCFLDAFHIGGSVRNVMLVIAGSTIATALPLTPGGAGVQQALLLQVFATSASSAAVVAYSVGQQVAIAVLSVAIGFVALFFVFGFRSFGEALRHSRAAHRAQPAAPAAPAADAPS